MLKGKKISKGFVSGILIGAMITSSISVIANNQTVTATKADDIMLAVDGESKFLPEGYSYLVYNGYTYLPSRFVAEQLGATVEWNESIRKIDITSPPPKVVEKIVEKPVETIVYVDASDPRNPNYKPGTTTPVNDGKDYRSLPTSKTLQEVRLEVINAVIYNEDYLHVNVKVENQRGQFNARLGLSEAVLTVDGKKYATEDLPSSKWDLALMNADILPNKDMQGYLSFPFTDKSATKATITLPLNIYTNTGAITETYTFDVNLDLD